jgi:hypothetical protein
MEAGVMLNDVDLDEVLAVTIAKRRMSAKTRRRARLAAAAAAVGVAASTRVKSSRSIDDEGQRTRSRKVTVGGRHGVSLDMSRSRGARHSRRYPDRDSRVEVAAGPVRFRRDRIKRLSVDTTGNELRTRSGRVVASRDRMREPGVKAWQVNVGGANGLTLQRSKGRSGPSKFGQLWGSAGRVSGSVGRDGRKVDANIGFNGRKRSRRYGFDTNAPKGSRIYRRHN